MQALSSLPERTVTVVEPLSTKFRLLWFVIVDPDNGECSGAAMRFINFARELMRSGVSVYFAVNCWPGQDIQKMQEYLLRLKEQKVIAGSLVLQYRYSRRHGTLGALAFYPGLTNVILKSVRAPAIAAIREFVDANKINLFINSDRMLLFLGPALLDHVPVISDWTDSLVLHYSRALGSRVRNQQFKGLLGFFRDFQTNVIAEAYYGRRSTFNIVVSPVDRKWMDRTNLCPSKNRLILNGTKIPALAAPVKISKRLIFSGVMDFAPNYEGALWFIDKVFPLVLKRHPDAKLVVAGMNPVPELTACASEHVHVTGFVKDMGAEIACSSLYISPMISGSGFKNKIIEALANGTYVVATPMSVEFLTPNLRDLLSIARNGAEMARAINMFLDDPSQFDERLEQIQAAVISQFSWRTRSLDLLQVLGEAYTSHPDQHLLSERIEIEKAVTIKD